MTRARKAERLDRVDSELIRETLQSPGWQLIKRGLEKMLDRKVRDLVRPQTEVETANCRGAIGAIETALEMPQILIQEGKNQHE